MKRNLIILVLLSGVLIAAAGRAGATLYNGIVLPDTWPPRRTMSELRAGEVMKVPYLEQKPEVIPVDVGRQLLVDDFLVEQTTLVHRFHKAEFYDKNPVLRPDKRWEMIYPVRFHLRNGSLYAFWVSRDPSGASDGYVAAGGPGFTGPTDTVGQAGYAAVTGK